MKPVRIPLSVIGGYLGAGKTTLINRILTGDHGRRIAVIVNDFGAVNVDESLLVDAAAGIRALANGCICCQAVDGLATALEEIAAFDPAPEHVLIEASGVSDPWAIAQWGRTPRYALDGVIVVVDPTQIEAWTDDDYVGSTVSAQLRSADLIVMSRGDVASQSELVRIEGWLAERSAAKVFTGPDVSLALLLGPAVVGEGGRLPHASHSTRSFVPRATTRAALAAWLETAPLDVVRVKGFVPAEEGLLLVQRVGPRGEVIRSPIDRDPIVTVIARVSEFPDAATGWISTISDATEPG